jgi:hypothetical protein
MTTGRIPSVEGGIQPTIIDAAGDLIYGASNDTPAILAIGTAGQVLAVNTGETAPEWVTPATSGTAIAGAYATVATDEATSSGTFTNLTTTGPAVSVTTGTKALVIFSCSVRSTIANANARMSFAVSGATTRSEQTNEWTNTIFGSGGAAYNLGIRETASAAILVTGLTAGSNTFTAKYAAPGGDSCSFQFRKITVIDLGS